MEQGKGPYGPNTLLAESYDFNHWIWIRAVLANPGNANVGLGS
ncbi:uncharacterized protein G2W53_037470 [Senna tora]|uniref:Uncharacterized protein n=1 Tax=Senna tora TaxID=362788 RepID=A0A834W5W3_9FABA|nr:uncharacterized protein G2W53_037470 [Senna tora]